MEATGRATERQLRDYDQAGAITAARIVKTEDGYVVVIQLSWKPGHIVVYNERNRPRAWRSLDRLLLYLGEIAPTIRVVSLELDGQADRKAAVPPKRSPAKKSAVQSKAVKSVRRASTARKAERR